MYRASSQGRFAIALALALAVHALLLAGVDLPRYSPPSAPAPIAITLSGYPVSPPSTEPTEPTEPPPVEVPAPPAPRPTEPVIDPPPPKPVQPTPAPLAGKTAAELVRDVAALALPETGAVSTHRVRRLHANAETTPEFAYYLEAWRRKVERIGNLNYPQEARRRALSGSLRMLVTITADGGLTDVRVLETSGHRVLDEAAVRIVRLAAPYAPFSPRMRATTEVLEIERTWHFRNSRYSS